jgi:hypothetical protein
MDFQSDKNNNCAFTVYPLFIFCYLFRLSRMINKILSHIHSCHINISLLKNKDDCQVSHIARVSLEPRQERRGSGTRPTGRVGYPLGTTLPS